MSSDSYLCQYVQEHIGQNLGLASLITAWPMITRMFAGLHQLNPALSLEHHIRSNFDAGKVTSEAAFIVWLMDMPILRLLVVDSDTGAEWHPEQQPFEDYLANTPYPTVRKRQDPTDTYTSVFSYIIAAISGPSTKGSPSLMIN